MTSSILAALLMIFAVIYILLAQRRIMAALVALAFVALGYIAGSQNTQTGQWIQVSINAVMACIDWIANAF